MAKQESSTNYIGIVMLDQQHLTIIDRYSEETAGNSPIQALERI